MMTFLIFCHIYFMLIYVNGVILPNRAGLLTIRICNHLMDAMKQITFSKQLRRQIWNPKLFPSLSSVKFQGLLKQRLQLYCYSLEFLDSTCNMIVDEYHNQINEMSLDNNQTNSQHCKTLTLCG
uniref:Uncharacterized protein n=1 Tax=Wuchereria bancrofti TaxID=6293 RepID=A0AAF5Q298_WUCBA